MCVLIGVVTNWVEFWSHVVAELKSKRLDMPLTLIYGKLETNSVCFPYFPMKWAKTNTTLQQNLQQRTDFFTMYHAQYPEHERRRIVDELVNGKSSHCVLFVTVAFGIGIDCNNIRRIVHIGVRYMRLGGLAEMVFQLGLTHYYSYDIPKAHKKHARSHEVLCPVQGM